VIAIDRASLLDRLGAIASELGAERLAADARARAERVAEGLFFAAFVGQFKRGKSTLINALVGEPILPAGVVPVTAIPTVIRFGSQRAARIRTQSGAWQEIGPDTVEQYVSEEKNPGNKKGVSGVEIFLPCPLLATGMCLVDTPGLGSVFTGNTAATHEFIPHIDAAVVVIGTDPPLAGDELELVKTVAAVLNDILLVLNKADRVTEAERSAASTFARRMLAENLETPIGPIFEISAAERLQGRGPERDWGNFVRSLEELAEGSGRITQAAGERGVRRISKELLATLHQETEAMLRPAEESERRITALRETLAQAGVSLRELGALLGAEQQRLSQSLIERRKMFLRRALPPAQEELSGVLHTIPRRGGPGFRRSAMSAAQDIARRHVEPWLESEQAFAEEAYRQGVQRFVQLSNDFLRRLAAADVPELAEMPEALDLEPGFRTRSRFHFHELVRIAQPASPFRYLADQALGLMRAYGGIAGDALRFVGDLMEINSSRVQNDIDERMRESRRQLESEIRGLLHDVRSIAERAIVHAREARAAGAQAVTAALERLAALEAEVRSLRGPEDVSMQ